MMSRLMNRSIRGNPHIRYEGRPELLSFVVLLAAWSGYSAAKWGTESPPSLAKALSTRDKASLALIQGTQILQLLILPGPPPDPGPAVREP